MTYKFDYTNPIDRKRIVTLLHQWTEEITKEDNPSEHRTHLGASVIGDDCSRKLWYHFRWVKTVDFDANTLRLFNRGKYEEQNFEALFARMGFLIRNIDPATMRQYNFSMHENHYGGSGDSIAIAPWNVKEWQAKGYEFKLTNEPVDIPRLLVEYKTYNKTWFGNLESKGLKLVNPKHWAQMCAYGKAFNVKYGIYAALCKDNDRYWFDFLELDWNYAQQLENKAYDVITAQYPPNRISDNAAYHLCKLCGYTGICHFGQTVETNCRSCRHATPAAKGEWHCSQFNALIPKDFIKQGCPQHASINA